MKKTSRLFNRIILAVALGFTSTQAMARPATVRSAASRSRITVTDTDLNRRVIFIPEDREGAFVPRKGWGCRYKEQGGRASLECQGPSVLSPVLRVDCTTQGADATSMKLFTDSRSKAHSEVVLSCRKEQ